MTTKPARSVLFLLCVLLALGTSAPSLAADHESIELDLATCGTRTFEVSSGTKVTVELTNRLFVAYQVEILRTFALPDLSPPENGSQLQSDSESCQYLLDSVQEIRESTNEADLAAVLSRARGEIDTADPRCRRQIRALRHAIDATNETLGTYRLRGGDVLTVKVRRPAGDGEKTCEATISTEPSGRWLTSYGFTFVPNRNDEFFTRSLGEDKFEIAEISNDRSTLEDLDFVPSFFYSYLPRRYQDRDWSPGITFGLGFDQSSPAVFVGGSLDYRRFASLIAGVVVHEQQTLDGRYTLGQELTMALNEDDLHDESYGLNFFIGVSFRFNGNPFQQQEGGGDQPQEVPTPQEEEGSDQPEPAESDEAG